jgi:glycosyltransferase involved in cell wall biosynthesis
MKLKKVFLIQEIIPSYRVPVFRRIASLDGVDLTVFYSRQSRAMARENLKSAAMIEGFRHVQIGLQELGSRTYQFGIIWRVLRERPDIVIAGQQGRLDRLLLLLLCKMLRMRILWFEGGVPYVDAVSIRAYATRGRLNRWFGRYNPVRLLAQTAHGMIVYSEHAKGYYADQGYRQDRIWVAPNSPDTDALEDYRRYWLSRPEVLETEHKRVTPRGQKILFLLGRLNKERRADVLLRAAHKLRSRGLDTSVVIIGDGSETERLKQLASELGLDSVFFEGAIYDEKVLSRYFIISDIFVTPGVSSLAIKMAMALGCQVATVDYGLEVHAVQHGYNGLIFPIDDAVALADTLESTIRSDTERNRIASNAMKTIHEEINIGTMIEGFRGAIFADDTTRNHSPLQSDGLPQETPGSGN